MDNRLTRSLRDRMLTGVAGGMAEYFDIDPVIIRLLWVLGAVFTGGLLVLVYFVMAIIMPSPPEDEEEYEDEDEDEDLDEEEAARRLARPTTGARTRRTKRPSPRPPAARPRRRAQPAPPAATPRWPKPLKAGAGAKRARLAGPRAAALVAEGRRVGAVRAQWSSARSCW